ncbi:MAG: hypothetical protein ISQ08_03770 [Planctomycetes bacterium]|nr:hypothetical protein [Planctomycetota bacterium]MDA0947228.1 hypothetical protein [Planctomycetota bacterium]
MTSPFPPLAERLKSKLDPQDLDSTARNLLADSFSEPIVEEMSAYATGKGDLVAELVDALGEAGDEEELYRTITDLWLELKFEWARHNQVMNYQLIRKGEADPRVMARGGVCSHVIMALESLLRPRDIAGLTSLVAAPLEHCPSED